MNNNNNKILEVKNVSKHFGGIHALTDVSFDIEYGEVHALVGENGAGKSTLINILGGIIEGDKGEIFFKGNPTKFKSPIESLHAGIAIIHQELAMLPTLNVIENVFMGRMESRGGIVDWKNLEKKTREALSMVGLEIDPHKEVRDLSISHRQLIEIAKAVSMNASLIIMDEPNSSLSDSESEKLFEVIAQLKARNVSIIYVSHKISEVIRISDRISVLRDGHFMGTSAKGDATANSIIEMMVGRNVNIERPEGTSCDTNKILLEVKNLSGNAFENVSFTLHVGEVMGFAGLVGAGRSEVARAIFGADPIKSGEIFFEGQKVHFNLPSEAIYKGLSMVPEDRKLLSLFMDMPILYNMSIANLPRQASSGFIKNRAERETAQNYVESLSVKLSNLMAPVRSLSGGNQQKTVLARWLATNPKVLILDEPTHGVDVGAKSEIYQLIRQLASKGMGIILISSELPEIMALSDRVVVMHQGKMTALLEREEATEARIMACALA